MNPEPCPKIGRARGFSYAEYLTLTYDLFHLTEIEDMDGSYKKALDRLVKAEAELKKAYPANDEILDEYQSADIELHNLSNRNEFRKVFKVGAQLVLEMIKPIK